MMKRSALPATCLFLSLSEASRADRRQKERFGAFYLALIHPVHSRCLKKKRKTTPARATPSTLPVGFSRAFPASGYLLVRATTRRGGHVLLRNYRHCHARLDLFCLFGGKVLSFGEATVDSEPRVPARQNARGRTEASEGRLAKRRRRRASAFRSRQKLLIRQCVRRAGWTIVELSE